MRLQRSQASKDAEAAKAKAEGDAMIDAERDRRMRAGFMFGGKLFDFDDASKTRIVGAAALAGFAQSQGAVAGNYRWANPTEDFGWIANDNTVVTLDAPSMFGLGAAAAEHERAHIFAARALKDADPLPADWKEDHYWP